MFYISKSVKKQLTTYLSHKEFRCKCKRKICAYTLVSQKLLRSFDLTRKGMGVPLTVNSGFRCQAHNLKVGGVFASYHTLGAAIDLTPSAYGSDKELQYQLDRLELIAKDYFDFTKRYETFIHCHITQQ